MPTFTAEQYDLLLRMLCPFCQYGIPDVRECDGQHWMHSIPDTNIKGICWANRIRGKLTVTDPLTSAQREPP